MLYCFWQLWPLYRSGFPVGIPGSCYKGGSAGLGLVGFRSSGFRSASKSTSPWVQQIWDDPCTWHDGTQHALGPGSLWDTVQGLPWHFNSRKKPCKLRIRENCATRRGFGVSLLDSLPCRKKTAYHRSQNAGLTKAQKAPKET